MIDKAEHAFRVKLIVVPQSTPFWNIQQIIGSTTSKILIPRGLWDYQQLDWNQWTRGPSVAWNVYTFC